jgi:hypothetical protein
MNELKDIIKEFETISLEEVNLKAALLERVDTKYVLSFSTLKSVLEDCKESYKILKINDCLINRYETIYFDTDDLHYYHQHQAGRLNRVKVRLRKYIESEACYLEVKKKTNKGISIKLRTSVNTDEAYQLNFLDKPIFASIRHLIKDNLVVSLQNAYSRITLVDKYSPERITIDLSPSFWIANKSISLPDYVIIENKHEKNVSSSFRKLMKKHKVKKGGISKYCLGIISLYQDVKKNNFKPILKKLEKTILYDFFANTNQ